MCIKFGRQLSEHERVSGFIRRRNLRRIFDEDIAAEQRIAGLSLRDADRWVRKAIRLCGGAGFFDHAECVCDGDHAVVRFSDSWRDRGVSRYAARYGNGQRFSGGGRARRIESTTAFNYSTYLGRFKTDAGQGIAVAAQNAVYVTGQTTSWDFPWRDNLQPFNGAGDAFIAKLDPTSAGSASLIYATPLGGTSPTSGSASATGNGIAADGSGHVYVAGATTAANFPTPRND